MYNIPISISETVILYNSCCHKTRAVVSALNKKRHASKMAGMLSFCSSEKSDPFCFESCHVARVNLMHLDTLPETNSSSVLKITQLPKGKKLVFQPSTFRCDMLVSERHKSNEASGLQLMQQNQLVKAR